jgi:hypothetical protein
MSGYLEPRGLAGAEDLPCVELVGGDVEPGRSAVAIDGPV